jgi:hypothetical protein
LAKDAQAAAASKIASTLEKEGVALDIGGYRAAPPGLRIWCGATVRNIRSLKALTPWLDLGLRAGESVVAIPPPASASPFGLSRGDLPAVGGGKTRVISCPRSWISDKLSPAAIAIFKDRGVEADVKTGLSKDELIRIIGDL